MSAAAAPPDQVHNVVEFVRYAGRIGYVVRLHDVPDDLARAAIDAGRIERYPHPGGIRWTCLRLTDQERQ